MEILSKPIFSALPKLTPIAVLDILLTAFLIYQFFMIVRGRRAAQVLVGVLILVMVYLAALWTGLDMLRTMLATLAPYTAFALIVMFQSEIRRMLTRIGRRGWPAWGSRLQRREFTTELVLAIDRLAQRKTGALIMLEREVGLRTFIESGVLLEAAVSRDLLLSIFHPGGALHDGAVIIQGERVAAAACFLPLSTNPALASMLGTRHRAAIGITEESDCLSLVVSEETGRISIAAFGDIELNVSLERAEQRIAQHIGGVRGSEGAAHITSGRVHSEAREADWGAGSQ